jgi:hypothetical protein
MTVPTSLTNSMARDSRFNGSIEDGNFGSLRWPQFIATSRRFILLRARIEVV